MFLLFDQHLEKYLVNYTKTVLFATVRLREIFTQDDIHEIILNY